MLKAKRALVIALSAWCFVCAPSALASDRTRETVQLSDPGLIPWQQSIFVASLGDGTSVEVVAQFDVTRNAFIALEFSAWGERFDLLTPLLASLDKPAIGKMALVAVRPEWKAVALFVPIERNGECTNDNCEYFWIIITPDGIESEEVVPAVR